MYKKKIIDILFRLYKLSLEYYNKNPDLSRKYIYYLLRIKSKFRLYLPKELRNKFCKRCYTPWIIGKTLDVRIRKGKIIYHCKICNNVKRFDIMRYKNLRADRFHDFPGNPQYSRGRGPA